MFSAHTVKINVEIMNWPFKNIQNSLDLIFGAKNSKDQKPSCVSSQQDSGDSLKWLLITVNGTTMYLYRSSPLFFFLASCFFDASRYGQFQDAAIVDGKPRNITYRLLEDNSVAASMPHFWVGAGMSTSIPLIFFFPLPPPLRHTSMFFLVPLSPYHCSAPTSQSLLIPLFSFSFLSSSSFLLFVFLYIEMDPSFSVLLQNPQDHNGCNDILQRGRKSRETKTVLIAVLVTFAVLVLIGIAAFVIAPRVRIAWKVRKSDTRRSSKNSKSERRLKDSNSYGGTEEDSPSPTRRPMDIELAGDMHDNVVRM